MAPKNRQKTTEGPLPTSLTEWQQTAIRTGLADPITREPLTKEQIKKLKPLADLFGIEPGWKDEGKTGGERSKG